MIPNIQEPMKFNIIKPFIQIFLFSCFIIYTNLLSAREITDSIKPNNLIESSLLSDTRQRDVKDIIKNIFWKSKYYQDSLKFKKVYVTLLPAAGYTLQTGVAAAFTAGAAFYTETEINANNKISNVLTSLTYTQYNQFLFPIAANIWTKSNKYNIAVDYRFLKYPSTNYGIGSRTSENDAYTLNFSYIKLHQTILRKIYKDLYGGLGFYYDYFYDIKEVDPPAGVHTSFEKYSNKKQETAVGIAYKVLYDSRDNDINARIGTYASVIYRPNYTALGSDKNWKSLQIEYRKYIPLFGSKKNTLALWSFNWFNIGREKSPYLLLPSTGWDDQYNTGRGYIQSRFRAKNMIYAEAEYRFGITENGLLGGVVFANAQSFSRNFSNQFYIVSPGFGAGLRIKLNKYSNTNLCIDYGFGLNGSKGLFLNFGEVF